MNENREYDRLDRRVGELEAQVAELQRTLDDLIPQYKELARYVADVKTRLHEVEGSVAQLTWKSAA